MRRKIVGILVCTLLIITAIPAVGTMNSNIIEHNFHPLSTGIEWNYTYDGGEFDDIRHIEQTSDGGYISFGITESSDNYYAHLIKFDAGGNMEWDVTNTNINGTYLGSTDNDIFCMHIQETPDGGYIANGWSSVYTEVMGQWIWFAGGFLWKTNAVGTTEWLEHYYSAEELAIDLLYHPYIVTDGYVVVGHRLYYDEYATNIYTNGTLMKVDNTGAIVWQQFYDLGGDAQLTAISQTSDDGYILGGCIDIPSLNDGALLLIKTDNTGNMEWHQIFDGPGFEYSYVRDCFPTPDGGYIFCGNTGSYGHGAVDVWVIKTDSNGVLEWHKSYGDTHNDYTWDMEKTYDEKFVIVICRNYQWYSGTKDDIWLVQLNENNFTEWTYLVEESGKQIPSCIRETEDHGFIVSGRTNEYGYPSSDGIAYKFAPAGTNNAPETPVVTGTVKPAVGKEYNYTLSAIDPDDGDIKYYIDWGDESNTPLDGPFESGEEVIATHTYQTKGEYTIEVTAIDAFDEESPVGTLDIEAPYNKPSTTDSIFGWTIIRGFVANMKKQGNDLYFRAVRLHYTEITGMEMSTGIIRQVYNK